MTIEKYFDGKDVLVTGATGLMGKALVEKLLRSCPGVAKIYVIIRPKRGCDPKDRWTATTQSQLYDYLKKHDPESLSKVVVMAGDGAEDGFGLSEQDQKMLIENVNLVYHMAASINFFNNMTRALQMNVKSTYSLLELARKMKKLERFVHVSTAYCNFTVKGEILEEIYDSHLDWRSMLGLIKHENQSDAINALEPKLMNGHLSTYTLTKELAENVVRDYNQYFPTIIVRPTLVTGTAKDPVPGWLDVDNFITLFSRGVRMGVLRVVGMSKSTFIEMIPLDLSVRGIIVASWKQSVHPNKGTDVYCHRVDGDYRLRMGDLQSLDYLSYELPSRKALWHSYYFLTSNRWVYAVSFFLLHLISGVLIDTALQLSGQMPRLKRIYSEIYRYSELKRYYNFPHHTFSDTKFRHLESIVPEEDKKDFSMDYFDTDKLEILKATSMSVVRNVWKDNIDDEKALEKARKRSRKLKILHYSLCAMGLAVLLKIVSSALSTYIAKPQC